MSENKVFLPSLLSSVGNDQYRNLHFALLDSQSNYDSQCKNQQITLLDPIPMDLDFRTFEYPNYISGVFYMTNDRLFVITLKGEILGQDTPDSRVLTYQFNITNDTNNSYDRIHNPLVSSDRRFFIYKEDKKVYIYDTSSKNKVELSRYCGRNCTYAFYTNTMILVGEGKKLTLINCVTMQSVYITTTRDIDNIRVNKDNYIFIENDYGSTLLDYYSFVQITDHNDSHVSWLQCRENILFIEYINKVSGSTLKILTNIDDRITAVINKSMYPERYFNFISVIDGYVYFVINKTLYTVSKNQNRLITLHEISEVYGDYTVHDGYYISAVIDDIIVLYKTMKHSRDLGYWLLLHDLCNDQLFESNVIPIIADYIY